MNIKTTAAVVWGALAIYLMVIVGGMCIGELSMRDPMVWVPAITMIVFIITLMTAATAERK